MYRTASYGSFINRDRYGGIQLVPDICCAGAQLIACAAIARWPASPFKSVTSEAAMRRSSSFKSGLGVPYHSKRCSALHSSVLSR